MVASEYLKGEAYKFYMNNVSWELKNWKYQKFMKALFNACFPATFRMEQQERLDTIKQEDRTVREFESELKLLYRVVGKARKRERVRKFWRGLQPRIQQKLYEAGYDYETSQWGQVAAAAEMFEIARTIGMDTKRSPKEPRKDNRDRGHSSNKEKPRNEPYSENKEETREDRHRRKSSRSSRHFGRRTNGQTSNDRRSKDHFKSGSSSRHDDRRSNRRDEYKKLSNEEHE
ncbi:hypothetical protein H0H93_016363, partial [Arthromyces matolae]